MANSMVIHLTLSLLLLSFRLVSSNSLVREQALTPLDDGNYEGLEKGNFGNLEFSAIIRRVLLVASLDGSIHAFDKYTGFLLWHNKELGGPLLGQNVTLQNKTVPFYLAEPQDDGPLYIYVPDVGIKKLPVTVKSLVGQSPVRWPDGTFFIGQKKTHFYALDISTGRILYSYDPQEGLSSNVSEEMREALSGRSRSLILIARTDYSLTCFPPSPVLEFQSPSWRLSYSEFSSFMDPFKNETKGKIFTQRELNDQEQIFYSSINGIIAAKDRHTSEIMWIRRLPATATNFFKLNEPLVEEAHGPIMAKVPISPRGSTPSALIISAEELKVTVGEYLGTFYILPSDLFPFLRPSTEDEQEEEDDDDGEGDKVDAEDKLLHLSQPANTLVTEVDVDCIPGSESYPACLRGSHVAEIVRPVPLLSAHSSYLEQIKSQFLPLPTTLLIILSSLIIWTLVFRRSKNRPTLNHNPLQNTIDPSLIGIRPPGFEEISISSADMFYNLQNSSSDHSPPKSFTVTDEIIGYGSHGTVVFKGMFDGRLVAVKRMLVNFYDIAGHEVNLLQQSDHHPNVIRYFCREQTDKFAYIVLELCLGSLADIIEPPEEGRLEMDFSEFLRDPQSILEQITKGLAHLHAMKLVHRDIKPHNILITPQKRMVISDFGLSKKLSDDQSSFHPTVQAGTVGWRAPECILGEEAEVLSTISTGKKIPLVKISKSVDIFALGCVFYYVLSQGDHPFGSRLKREINIINNQFDLQKINSLPEAEDLIKRMIDRDPQRRPSCPQVLVHPYFWTAQKQVAFLLDLSDRFEYEDRKTSSELLARFEARKRAIFEGNYSWNRLIDSEVWFNLCTYRKYNGQSARDLLRALRNKRNHFQELGPELRQILGETPEAFMNYFLSRFPRLLIESYRFVDESGLRDENPFSNLYFI